MSQRQRALFGAQNRAAGSSSKAHDPAVREGLPQERLRQSVPESRLVAAHQVNGIVRVRAKLIGHFGEAHQCTKHEQRNPDRCYGHYRAPGVAPEVSDYDAREVRSTTPSVTLVMTAKRAESLARRWPGPPNHEEPRNLQLRAGQRLPGLRPLPFPYERARVRLDRL